MFGLNGFHDWAPSFRNHLWWQTPVLNNLLPSLCTRSHSIECLSSRWRVLSNCGVSCNIDLHYDYSRKGKHCLGKAVSMIWHLAFATIPDGSLLSWIIYCRPYVPRRIALTVYPADDECCLIVKSLVTVICSTIIPGRASTVWAKRFHDWAPNLRNHSRWQTAVLNHLLP